jgi:hypothetical protein
VDPVGIASSADVIVNVVVESPDSGDALIGTLTVPFMVGWIVQWFAKEPGPSRDLVD